MIPLFQRMTALFLGVGGKQKYTIKVRRFPLLGKGHESKVHSAKIKSHTTLFKNGKIRVAVRRMRKKYKKDPVTSKDRILSARITWRDLKGAGLPVPAFFVPILRKKSKEYLSVMMEDLSRTYGKIIPINTGHNQPHPWFLKKLTLKKDSELISAMAGDFAKITSLGYVPGYIDFWMFYRNKKTGKLNRLIVDIFDFERPTIIYPLKIASNLLRVSENMGKEEYALFQKEYFAKLNKPGIERLILEGLDIVQSATGAYYA